MGSARLAAWGASDGCSWPTAGRWPCASCAPRPSSTSRPSPSTPRTTATRSRCAGPTAWCRCGGPAPRPTWTPSSSSRWPPSRGATPSTPATASSPSRRRSPSAAVTPAWSFVGPEPETLAVLGDKVAARALAARCGLAVLPGTEGPTTPDEAHAFLTSLGEGAAVMVKAVAGGGGRGMRPVTRPEDLDAAMAACAREAAAAFGDGARLPGARSSLGPATSRSRSWATARAPWSTSTRGSAASSAGARSWSRSRRRPTCPTSCGRSMTGAAVRLGQALRYRGVGTVELLVDLDAEGPAEPFSFIEANARIQVEHTVTEEVTGCRPRPGPAATGRRRGPRRARPRPGRHRAAPRRRRAGPGERRATPARRHGRAGLRHDHGLRAARRSRRPRRRVGLRRRRP